MDSNFLGQGTVLDPAKCSKMSMEEKRELVYELSKNPHGTPEMLQSWSRQEILQLLCAEMGKERKYTGLTKIKIIENLFKIISEKNSRESGARVSEQQISDSVDNRTPKGQKKPDHLSRLTTPLSSISRSNCSSDLNPVIYCKNSACKASLSPHYVFCKRCSCCICQKFDDNKDPSLWLTCTSEPPSEGESCNMSCHLECAVRHERSGLSKMGQVAQLDGSFYCVSCGKMNDLLKCWRKQLMIARDTRRVDILCYRVFLSQKLLSGTNRYQQLSDIVDEAVNKLQAEVGPLTDITVKMGRGIVNRMSAGQEVQRLCSSAVDLLDLMLSEATAQTLTHHVVQDSRIAAASSIKVVSFDVFRESSTSEARVSSQETIPKPTPESSRSPVTNCSTLSNPSSVEDEMNITSGLNESNKVENYFNSYKKNAESAIPTDSMNGPINRIGGIIMRDGGSASASNDKRAPSGVASDQSGLLKLENNEANGLNTPIKAQPPMVPCPSLVMGLPTPCRMDILKTVRKNGKSKSSKNDEFRNSSKKRSRESQEADCEGRADLEFYVKVVRRLECEGHIEKSFRQKFLTWYSLRATPREMQAVQVFIHALRDDPASLADQLIDAFEEIVSGQGSEADIPSGFCMKLWH